MRKKDPGVYKITNLSNQKFYIGSTTVNLGQRWNDHKSQLKTGIHPNIHLQRSYNKHGKEIFHFEILERCTDVLVREQYYMDILKPQYNIYVLQLKILLVLKELKNVKNELVYLKLETRIG